MKTILKTSVFLVFFFNSCLLLGNNNHEVKPFKFDLPFDADLDRLPNDLDEILYAIFIEDDIIWINTEQTSSISIIDPLIKATHFSKDTLIKIDLKSNLSSFLGYQIEFEERGNLEIFFLTPIDNKNGLYELFVKYKFNNQVIRFKGKNLSKQGLETFLLIKKTIDYSNNVQILNILKTECGEQNYSEDSLSRFGFQILDIKHQSELFTFKLVLSHN